MSSGSLSLLPSGSNVGDPTLTQNRNKSLKEDSPACGDFRGNLPNFMRGVNVFFFNVDEYEKKKLARYLVAYPLFSIVVTYIFLMRSLTPFLVERYVTSRLTPEQFSLTWFNYDGEVSHFACQSVTHVVCDKHADTSVSSGKGTPSHVSRPRNV